VYTVLDGANVTVTGTNSGSVRRVEVASAATAAITLDGATISGLGNNTNPALNLNSGASLTLTLKSATSSSLTGGNQAAGIRVHPSAALIINGAGELLAQNTGNVAGAGIGGAYQETNGNITITSGTVTAKSPNGAGIGGGYYGHGGNITISGGTVHAEGSNTGAGIGGGVGGNGGTVIISGGDVTAISKNSGNSGYGIGSGRGGSGGTLTIKGGVITASSDRLVAFSGTVSFDSSGGLTGYNYTTSPNFNGSSPTGPTYTTDLSAWSDFSSKWVNIECNP
jgi:hypothetical protein